MKNDFQRLLTLPKEELLVYHKDLKNLLLAKGVPESDVRMLVRKVHISLKRKIQAKELSEDAEWLKESLKVPQEPIMHNGMFIILSSDEEKKAMIEGIEKFASHGVVWDKHLVKELVEVGFFDEEIGDALWLTVENVRDFQKK